MHPCKLIEQTRLAARLEKDENSETCFLAIASNEGKASVRTLILRNIIENNFTLFINKSSPKWRQLSQNCHYELLLWYPSQQKQFRINGSCRVLEYTDVCEVWKGRPASSKYMDVLYQELPQSSTIPSRKILKDNIEQIKTSHDTDKLAAPLSVSGVELKANKIEILDLAPSDLSHDDRIHDRQLFQIIDDHWRSEVLIP